MATNEVDLKPVLSNTVREHPENENVGGNSLWDLWISRPFDIISPYGTRQRAIDLREFSYKVHGTLVQGAFAGFIQNIASTPYEISGGERKAYTWQDIFQQSEFGEGWEGLIEPLMWDVLTQDIGGFLEIIGPGPKDKAMTGQAVGVAHLDALRCIATGNPEFPVVYYSEITNKLHRLHYTRVARLVDMRSPDTRSRGMGFCALSRMLSVANAQILLGRHQNELLSDMPPPGIVITNNINEGQLTAALKQYEHDRIADAQWTYRPLAHVGNIDKTAPASMEVVPFRTVPEGFDYEQYMQMHVNLVALALGVDPQDIWPLTGQPLGTGTQSKILHAKARGKGYGYVLKRLERLINIKILPPDLEFKFKFKDDQQDKEQAETAQVWVEVVVNLKNAGLIDVEMGNQILANNVESLQDVMLDEQGNVRVPDEEEEEDVQLETTAEDFTPLPTAAEAGTPGTPSLAPDGAQLSALRAANLDRQLDSTTVTKAIEATRVAFENAFAPALGNATEMRALLQRYSRDAYLDGLEHGGIEDAELDSEDGHTLDEWLVDQSSYVSDFIERESEIANPESKAAQWYSKSVYPMYLAGIRAVDENGLYSWSLGSAEVHCEDCQRLAGQKHRFRDWLQSGYMPKAETLKCNGFNCTCSLVRARGRPSGEF